MFLKQNLSRVLKFTTEDETTDEYLLSYKVVPQVKMWWRDSARLGVFPGDNSCHRIFWYHH